MIYVNTHNMRVPKKPSGRKRSPFYWWRRFKSHKYKPGNTDLLVKIQNGDFEYPALFKHAEWELHWMKEEQEEYIKNYTSKQDPKQDNEYVNIELRYRKRYKKIIEDAHAVEDRHLTNLVESLSKEFKVSKQKIATIMETFGGTTEELYLDVRNKYYIKNKYGTRLRMY